MMRYNSSMPTELVGTGRACRMLEVSQATLQRWIKDGLIEAIPVDGGERHVLTVEDVERFIQGRNK